MSKDNPKNPHTNSNKKENYTVLKFFTFFVIVMAIFIPIPHSKEETEEIKPKTKQEEKKSEQKENKPEVKLEQQNEEQKENQTTEKKANQKNTTVTSNYKNINGETINIDNSNESFIRYAGNIAGVCHDLFCLLDVAEGFVIDEANFSTKEAREFVQSVRQGYEYILSLSKIGIPEVFVNDYNKFCKKLTRAQYLSTITFGYEPNSKEPKIIYVYPKNAHEIGTILDELYVFKYNAYEKCTQKGLSNHLPG